MLADNCAHVRAQVCTNTVQILTQRQDKNYECI